MRKADNRDYDQIIRYLENDLGNCIYIYIDIKSYGLESDPVQVWVDEKDGELSLVAMKYFDSFQLYSKNNDFSYEDLMELLKQEKPSRVNGSKELIERMWPDFDGKDFTVEYGIVMKIKHYPLRGKMDLIETATEEDVDGIAELIINEPELNGGFTKEEISAQIRERIVNNLGASYIIKENGTVVAHNCINADTDKFSVGALTVVRADRRDTLYGSMLDAYLINKVIEAGKDCFVFLKEPRRIKMFKAMKNEVLGEYGRIKKA